ncbi:S1C family serine protease [Flexithrix dorotheae]|uniref:S1C family serine protease n=1 Tax=Flexithrix dorotheae TaxID=70993 RepID=UPI000378751F|nr:trypsin-like peptidase domain-containing protein [Flexithrix dorotheae]
MDQKKYLMTLVLASVFGGMIALAGFNFFKGEETPESISEKQSVVFSSFAKNGKNTESTSYAVPDGLNFMTAAERVTPAVVHIKTIYTGGNGSAWEEMIQDLWGEGDRGHGGGHRMSSGSGVIISSDGYIATNNHVIENASIIEVILDDKRSYRASVVGTDPTTDLALLKVKEDNLPFVPYGDSDQVKTGQWVLAVGNPFDLTSTVTAGIVSAKARNIGILRSRSIQNYNIEAFIQTDAAVNPGNSGGALVDLDGKLIGVNTAIATNTGSFAGYSFAVPVTLVRKVMDDLLSYGEVQRALMGVSIEDVDANLVEELGLDKVEGVFIIGVSPDGGAEEAGIKAGDIVIAIDENEVNNVSALQELVARNRPGDKINVVYKRNNQLYNVDVILKNKNNGVEIVKTIREGATEISNLGADVMPISERDKDILGITSGLRIIKLREGKLREARVEQGFIITHIDKQPIKTANELIAILDNAQGEFLIEGYYPEGQKVFYGLNF